MAKSDAETARGILSRVGSDLAIEVEKVALEKGFSWVATEEGFVLKSSDRELIAVRVSARGEIADDGADLLDFLLRDFPASAALGPYPF